MRIIIENEEQKKFLENFKKLPIYEKRRQWKGKRRGRVSRYEYFIFAGKKIPCEKLIHLLNTLENRYQLARHCLEEIRKECEIIHGDESDIEKLRKRFEDVQVEGNFLIKCEYFIFAIDTCLDTMSHIINLIYDFRIEEQSVSMRRVWKEIKKKKWRQKRDKFAFYLLKSWKMWIDEFRYIRNRMTHHQIIEFSSKLSHDTANKKVTYTKHLISVKIYEFTPKRRLVKIIEITKQLPKYFDNVIKNYQSLKFEFYKKLNSIIQ